MSQPQQRNDNTAEQFEDIRQKDVEIIEKLDSIRVNIVALKDEIAAEDDTQSNFSTNIIKSFINAVNKMIGGARRIKLEY